MKQERQLFSRRRNHGAPARPTCQRPNPPPTPPPEGSSGEGFLWSHSPLAHRPPTLGRDHLSGHHPLWSVYIFHPAVSTLSRSVHFVNQIFVWYFYTVFGTRVCVIGQQHRPIRRQTWDRMKSYQDAPLCGSSKRPWRRSYATASGGRPGRSDFPGEGYRAACPSPILQLFEQIRDQISNGKRHHMLKNKWGFENSARSASQPSSSKSHINLDFSLHFQLFSHTKKYAQSPKWICGFPGAKGGDFTRSSI